MTESQHDLFYRSKTLRVVAVADTHGLHDQVDVPPGDFFVHAGDLTREGTLGDILSLDHLCATTGTFNSTVLPVPNRVYAGEMLTVWMSDDTGTTVGWARGGDMYSGGSSSMGSGTDP